MAQKGINYAIHEAKEELLQVVNSMVGRGVPVTAIELILINLSASINSVVGSVVAKEQEEYSLQLQEEQRAEDERLREEHAPQELQMEEPN